MSLSTALLLLALGAPALQGAPNAQGDATPHWIWLPGEPADGQVATFQRAFELAGAVDSARLAGSCDNVMDVFLNGELVASGGDWARPVVVEVQDALVVGPNLIAVQARNSGGPAGLQLALGTAMPR